MPDQLNELVLVSTIYGFVITFIFVDFTNFLSFRLSGWFGSM